MSEGITIGWLAEKVSSKRRTDADKALLSLVAETVQIRERRRLKLSQAKELRRLVEESDRMWATALSRARAHAVKRGAFREYLAWHHPELASFFEGPLVDSHLQM